MLGLSREVSSSSSSASVPGHHKTLVDTILPIC